MEVYVHGIPPSADTHTLRSLVAHVLHSSPVNAKDARRRPLNFQLWLSQQDRYIPGGGNHRRINYRTSRSYDWTFARLIIPDIPAALALLKETKLRPITIRGKKLRFVAGSSKKKIPYDVVQRLLSVPFGGVKAILREQTARSLQRGFGLHLFQLGTINRDGEFASEHTVFDAAKVPIVSAAPSGPDQRNHTEKDEGNLRADSNKRARIIQYPTWRCFLSCEGGFRGMCIRIIKPEKNLTFRMNVRTIEQICWSPSSSPAPPPAFRPRPQARKLSSTTGRDPAGDDLNEDYLEPQDVIIRLSQPFVMEQYHKVSGHSSRLSEIPTKPHISPYCSTCIYISGYHLVEALESMAKLFNTPYPWEMHIQKSNWRRYTSTALQIVQDEMKNMPLAMAFQYQKLLSNRVLDPMEITQVINFMSSEDDFLNDGAAFKLRILQKLACDDALIRTRIEAKLARDFRPVDLKKRLYWAAGQAQIPLGVIEDESFFEVLTVYVTPTAMQLYGPSFERSNRILRQYRSKKDHFLRVSFSDEDLGSNNFIGVNKSYDVPAFLKARFGSKMKNGITIGGRVYEFLAYSQSSLREATVWFLTPFEHEGKTITAHRIRESLGDFSKIRNCPARYAARLSQAFSATHRGFRIDEAELKEIVKKIPDIERNDKCFSDGAGRISPALAKEVQAHIMSNVTKPKQLASALQIRIAGCKGMVFVEPRYEREGRGNLLCIRPSMIKFPGSTLEIEVAEAFSSPKPFNLNRPLIKILEDLGVPFEPLLKLQRQMETGIYYGIRSIANASIWLDKAGFGSAFHAPTILKFLHKHKMSFGNLPEGLKKFLQCSLTYAAIRALRSIKYKARINLPDCWTLVGGIDESKTLEEGEVFVCVKPDKGNTATQWLSGLVAVTRSPQMWPGDVRLLRAIGRPTSPFLAAQTNVIIFSAKGDRPEQDKMAGGDLDGDTYNIITQAQADLLPRRIVEPTAYPPAPKKVLDRPAEIADIADFVCEYMNNDYMGIVANHWLITADTTILGSEDVRCKQLAELYSIAVDFPKSGTPVNASRLPRTDSRKKPDFMIKSHEAGNEEMSYPSQKYLGRLFRDIQLPRVIWTSAGLQQPLFANFQFDDTPSRGSNADGILRYDDLPYRLAKDYLPELDEQLREVFKEKAVRMVDEYYQNMKYCAETFSLEDNEPLSEEECFLSMVGTPTRSPLRHQQSVRMTFFVSNFLNNFREELSKFDETLEDLEDVQYALGLAFAVWKLSRSDFEDKIFGCYSLNLIAFEAIVTDIERLEELIELSYPTEPMPMLLPHQKLDNTLDNTNEKVADAIVRAVPEAKTERNDEDDGAEYVLADEGIGEFD